MSLKYKYALFVGVLHTVLVILIYVVLQENLWLFILSEFLILFSLVLSYILYRQLIRPLELMQTGSIALIENDFTMKYVRTGQAEMDKLIEVYNTMIDRLRQERTTMEEQSQFLNKLIEVSPIGIVILDYDQELTDANFTAIEYLSLREPWQGKKLTDFNSELAEHLTKMGVGENRIIAIDGTKRYKCQVSHVMHRGFPRKFILIEELSDEIRELEKNAYGKVIRMMAHEVNNSMGAVNSILNTVLEFGFNHEEADLDLQASLDVAITRNKNLGVFMDNFAEVIRLPAPNASRQELNSLMRYMAVLFESQARAADITILLELSEGEQWMEYDKVQMEQVLSNVIKNAIESIGESGTIRLTTSNKPRSFCVIDNGPGIPEEIAPNLFTPFYSTKPTGQGVGLVLCREILQNHHADFSLRTDKESGLTSFHVIFN